MFRRGLVRLALAASTLACACALPACSLLLGEGFTDSDSDVQVPTPDSGNGSPDGQGGDGSPGANDGSPGTDAPVNPGVDSGDASGPGCPAAVVSFCDDFERAQPSDVKGSWDTIAQNASGNLAVVTAPNGGKHLSSSVTALGGQAQLSKTFATQPAKLHFELSLNVKSFASVGAVYVTGVVMQDGSNPPTLIYLFLGTSGLFMVQQVADGGGYASNSVPITLNTYHRIVVDLTFSGKLVVKVDGGTKVDENAKTYLVPKPPGLYLGAASLDNSGDDGSFELDDYVFTID